MLCEACVCKRDAPQCVRIRLWPLRRDDSSRVLIGAAGMCRSYWCRRNVGTLIGQRACRLLALARAAIDSTRAGASGSLKAATTGTYINIFLIILFSITAVERLSHGMGPCGVWKHHLDKHANVETLASRYRLVQLVSPHMLIILFQPFHP